MVLTWSQWPCNDYKLDWSWPASDLTIMWFTSIISPCQNTNLHKLHRRFFNNYLTPVLLPNFENHYIFLWFPKFGSLKVPVVLRSETPKYEAQPRIIGFSFFIKANSLRFFPSFNIKLWSFCWCIDFLDVYTRVLNPSNSLVVAFALLCLDLNCLIVKPIETYLCTKALCFVMIFFIESVWLTAASQSSKPIGLSKNFLCDFQNNGFMSM